MRTVALVLIVTLSLLGQANLHYLPMNPGASLQMAKWTIANSGANFLITNPDGTTSTIAKAAAITQSVTIFALPAKSIVYSCLAKTDTAFLGTTTLTATLGVTGSLTGCISGAYDMKAAVSNTNLSIALPTTPIISWAGTNLILALTSTIDNLSSISTGAIEIQVAWMITQ
jgi:hypothetical protein